MSNQINDILTHGEQIFYDLIWSPAEQAAQAALFIEFPLLAIWPWGPIIKLLLKQYSDKTFDGLKEVGDVTAIPIINADHAAAYTKASVTLSIIAHDNGIQSKEYINARDAALDAMSVFTHYNV